ncbi:MAG: TraM recognition domain-containing protein [Syntrophobacteraceae bacterium]
MDLPAIKIGLDKFRPVRWATRYTHCLLPGKSGEGKSKFIAHSWKTDELYGNAKILVEPSGELSRECFSISRGRPAYVSLDTPASLNPLLLPYDANTICEVTAEALNQVISILTPNERLTAKMRVIWDEAVKYCLSHNRPSLELVRNYIEKMIGDGVTRDGILARLNFVLGNERMKPILCGNDSIKWGELIQNQKSFIFDASGMTQAQMVFVGTLVTQGLRNTFRFERPKKYKPVSVYLDEAQNFINNSFITEILREGRKYRLSLMIATQQFAGMDDSLVRTLLNAGTIISFLLGAGDASRIAREMNCETYTLQNLPRFHVAYLTRNREGVKRGICKVPSPPYVQKIEPKKAEPRMANLNRRSKDRWFPLEPYDAR